MALKEFCFTLQECANKLEEEIKYNINDIHNFMFSNQMNETKMALEKAKDYHYKEIMDSIGEILKSIKKILFHQDKIEWLSKEDNFTKDELRRFSYVKRQVYAFSNNEQVTPVASIPSVKKEIASPVSTPSNKKELRRKSSEVSIGSLDAWEKYLDQKDKEEKEIEENLAELNPQVPKRTLSNARRRKKFVSSTLGGFLEGDETRRNLDSIFEDVSSIEDNERLSYSKSLESLDKMILNDEQSIELTNEISRENRISENTLHQSKPSTSASLEGSLECLHNMVCSNEIDSSNDVCENLQESTDKETDLISMLSDSADKLVIDAEVDSDLMTIINENMLNNEESIVNEIMDTFLHEASSSTGNVANINNAEEPARETMKPKIVDVIYKKKPS